MYNLRPLNSPTHYLIIIIINANILTYADLYFQSFCFNACNTHCFVCHLRVILPRVPVYLTESKLSSSLLLEYWHGSISGVKYCSSNWLCPGFSSEHVDLNMSTCLLCCNANSNLFQFQTSFDIRTIQDRTVECLPFTVQPCVCRYSSSDSVVSFVTRLPHLE